MTHLPPPQPDAPQQPASTWHQPQTDQTWAMPHSAGAPQRRGDPLGVVAVILAGVALLVGIVALVAQTLLITSGDFERIGAAAFVFSGIRLVVALAGAAVGMVGILRRDAPRTLAAIGFGACAALALSVLIGLINVPISALATG